MAAEKRLWQSHVFASLVVADFRIVLAGSICTFIAQQIDLVAGGFLAYTIANSAIAIGMVQLATGLPTLLLALFGGALADRLDRRSVLIAMQSLSCVAELTIAILVVTNQIQIWHLVGAGLVQGVVFSFQMPARHSIIRELVGRARLGNAIAVFNVIINLSCIVGPFLAGTLIDARWFGMANTYFLIAGIYMLAVVTSLLIPSFPSQHSESEESILASVTIGLKFLRGSTLLLTLVGMAFVPMVLGLPYQTLLPVFSKQVLALGAEGLGHLYTVSGIGALIGALLITSLRTVEDKRTVLLVLGILFGLALALFGLSQDNWTALGLLFIIGISSQSYVTLINALITTNTPMEFYGRIVGVYNIALTSTPLATFPLAAVADTIGVAATLTISGFVIMVFMLGVAMVNMKQRWRNDKSPVQQDG